MGFLTLAVEDFVWVVYEVSAPVSSMYCWYWYPACNHCRNFTQGSFLSAWCTFMKTYSESRIAIYRRQAEYMGASCFHQCFFPDLVMKEWLAWTTWTNGNFQTCGLASCIPDLVQLYPKSPFDICSRIQQQQKLWGWICCWIKGVVFIFDQFPEKQISEEKTWTPWHGNLFRGTPSTPLRTWCIHRFAHLWQFSSSCRTMSTSNLEVKLDGVATKQMWGFNNLYLKQWSFWVHLSIISEI